MLDFFVSLGGKLQIFDGLCSSLQIPDAERVEKSSSKSCARDPPEFCNSGGKLVSCSSRSKSAERVILAPKIMGMLYIGDVACWSINLKFHFFEYKLQKIFCAWKIWKRDGDPNKHPGQ